MSTPLEKAEQYKILTDLKRVDDQLLRVLADLAKFPDERKKLETRLTAAKAAFEKEKAQLDGSEKGLRQGEMALKEKEEYLKKAEGKLMDVKTNIEYQAALKELATHKAEKGELEEKAIGLMDSIDGERTHHKDAESKFKKELSAAQELLDKSAGQEAELEALRAKLLAERTSIASSLTPEARDLFDRVARRNEGAIVALVDGGRCQGCNMLVRPQLYNEILGNAAFHTCPHCKKILIARPPQIAAL